MNLASTLTLLAGGSGSGCRGPNCGRPKTIYHGTTAENVRGILKSGLKPGWAKNYDDVPPLKSPRVFALTDKEEALRHRYSSYEKHWDLAVVHIDTDKHKFRKWPGAEGLYTSDKTVRSGIARVEIYKHEDVENYVNEKNKGKSPEFPKPAKVLDGKGKKIE